ncbi:MAG: CaiB/BaiF CoA-transferase family protein [Halieaceae bacterium]|jgi:crotonobetainyl-CoA:carnitine CoA-transferase CaiB-like acyl-CoA transferase|nr:CaiB/BaiF CoA-transferase family protein [Halieaceae bacterium]
MGSLSHIRVLDLSRVLAGPWASQIFADLGAEVIKIERPGRGDDTRFWGPPWMPDDQGRPTENSAYFLCTNRGKHSLQIDLKDPEGVAQVREIARHVDVVIENFKVGDLESLGLDYASLSRDNPGLVYCSITGFGQTGPLAQRPGYDLLVQAMGGLMSITGEPDGEPMKVGVALSDIMTGLYGVIGTLAALAERDRSGQGQHVDVALMDVTMATLANQAANWVVGGVDPARVGNAHLSIVPYQSFETADGHIVVAVGNDSQFVQFCEVLGLNELPVDPRFARNEARVVNREVLIPLLAERMKASPSQHWIDGLTARNVPCGPINSVAEAFAQPQVAAREMVVDVPHPDNPDLKLVGSPIKLSRTPVTYDRPPPRLGEHDSLLGYFTTPRQVD